MAATGTRYYTPAPFEVDTSGVPYVGAQLFFYETNTSTPLDTYSDASLGTPNANPVLSDASGHFPDIWLTPAYPYKVVCYGPNPNPSIPSTPSSPQGTQLWTRDPVGPASGGATVSNAGILGEVRFFAGPSASVPTGWYLCYGQAVSRTTYASAFAVLGTAWGTGDGSTTFNLPDLRGRTMFGLDNMGGSAASRVTAGVSGIAGTTLGGTGGDQHAQQDTITATTSITDPGHTHPLPTTLIGGTVAVAASTPYSANAGGSLYTATSSATTGITAATTATSGLTGASQNMPPTAMCNAIIYLGV